jgi:DNA-binding response OmpR family regulator
MTMADGSILVVEDEENVRFMICEALKAEGYAVFEAVDGFEAVRVTLAAVPDLIIMDLNLPEKNGLSAIDDIRADERVRDIPILVSTALENVETEFMGSEKRRIQGFLEKPYKIDKLVDKVKELLGR